ncbi:hypothetical protein ACRALDRAFT_1059391 [Sodiomyces alcalophilus JCM 7366]|uniref:uncharacterized protein n=1 Tax=Sodiomyces alcalophilus JCM 7366 TaxID=591952 RepID=UPI0039B5C1F7
MTTPQSGSLAGTDTSSSPTLFPNRRPHGTRPPHRGGSNTSTTDDVFGSQLGSGRTTAESVREASRRGSGLSGAGRQTTLLRRGAQVAASDSTCSDEESVGGVKIEDPFYLEDYIASR